MKNYQQELFSQKTPYLQWQKMQEIKLKEQYGRQLNQHAFGKQIHTLPFSSCMDSVQGGEEFRADRIYLFVKSGGTLSVYAKAVFTEAFSKDADTVLAYADEDYKGSLKAFYGIEDDTFDEEITMPYRFGEKCADYRGAPWFKPDFSPDTLASFFYLGSVFAIRGDKILRVTEKYGRDISVYELAYRIFLDALEQKKQGKPDGIAHISKVLYTNDNLEDAERIDSSDDIRRLYHIEDTNLDPISVIIPSKDNAEVLEKCLKTLIRYTDYSSYEIIIVDNGSNPQQRMHITRMIDALKIEKKDLVIQYLYHKKEFNFSAMCNVGARVADGTNLLFLNDDIEVIDTNEGRQWLRRMAAYVRKSHVGAVGAKLYYPSVPEENGRYRIQHAGITNMAVGPAHKLGGMVDEGCLYHGHNTQNYDMLAVTAACMLIRKKVFDEMGGFDETFPVAYNDVEFCFRLYQKGYFNVQVNEAVLIHWESLSRGQDTSPEKQKRLADEKKRLYRKHLLLKGRDPFYSPNLVQWKKDVEYNTGYLYDFDRQSTPVLLGDDEENGKRKHAILKKLDFRNCLHAACKKAARIYDRLTGYDKLMLSIDFVGDNDGKSDDNVTIEGWFAVRNRDNADMIRKLWLIYETRNFDFHSVYEFEAAPKLREDVAQLLEKKDSKKNTQNTALSGIQVNFPKSALKPGTYRIGVLWDNKLVCDLEKHVEIPKF